MPSSQKAEPAVATPSMQSIRLAGSRRSICHTSPQTTASVTAAAAPMDHRMVTMSIAAIFPGCQGLVPGRHRTQHRPRCQALLLLKRALQSDQQNRFSDEPTFEGRLSRIGLWSNVGCHTDRAKLELSDTD